MVEVEPIKTTVEELRKLVNIQNFIGEPIEVEDKVIIPVSKVGVAFGIGENKSDKVLGGAAGGAGVCLQEGCAGGYVSLYYGRRDGRFTNT